MKVVVTGGAGYVGFHVGWAIAQGGHEVTLLDLTRPDPEWHDLAPQVLYDALPREFWDDEGKGSNASLKYVKANITDYPTLRKAFHGATAVIHTASYGISGREQLSAHMTQQEEVNVTGTRTIIAAATEAKVQALVYTSTYNVVFGGQQIKNGDESLPYFPLHEQSDHYSRTKTIAEMLVLTANGKSLPNTEEEENSSSYNGRTLAYESFPLSTLTSQPSPVSGPGNQRGDPPVGTGTSPPEKCERTLRTCALRLAGVMGLGERRHSSRVIEALRSGFLCTYGEKENLVDFIGIQNVVQAHIKAMMALLKGGCTSSCAGEAFLISDEAPKNHFEYFRPWYEGLGYGFPTVRLPLALIMVVAHVQQIIYKRIHDIFPFKPFITPAEVYKSGVTHYFSCAKAKRCFGYAPTRPNDQTQMVEYYKCLGCSKDPENAPFFMKFSVHTICAIVLCLLFYFIF
ncbi:short-chain dehydrogenase/reductase family 42E member 1-like [Macrobrachium nipponense]|uniref:short-chain dehydrogenase/reductase family 42E member 1-like n=1 Tax=Macrobrachium nipponense TaxID=159736 RepID=UPI0030C8C3FE